MYTEVLFEFLLMENEYKLELTNFKASAELFFDSWQKYSEISILVKPLFV